MSENKHGHCIQILHVHGDQHALTEWFKVHYLNRIPGGFEKYIESNTPSTEFSLLQATSETYATPQYFHSIDFKNLRKDVCSSLIKHQLLVGEKKYFDLACVLLHLATFLTIHGKNISAQSGALELVSGFLEHCTEHKTCQKFYVVPFAPCSKWYFLKGRNLLFNLRNENNALLPIRILLSIRCLKAALEIRDERSEF